MSDVLNVETRENTGTAATRRLRQAGQVPAVLYGHGGENLHLAVTQKQVDAMIRHQARHVELAGAVVEHALVKDLQWDALGIDVLHIDLLRVSLKEKVTLTVPIKLHGMAVGLNHHGSMNEILHEVEIRVTANNIPEAVELNVNDLDIGQTKTLGDLELPEGAELTGDPESVVVQMNEQSETSDSADGEEGADSAEPEVIGEKKEDGDDE